MEEKGLLIPAYIAPKSGRRYYDNDNISRILHVQQFQSMGFSKENQQPCEAIGFLQNK